MKKLYLKCLLVVVFGFLFLGFNYLFQKFQGTCIAEGENISEQQSDRVAEGESIAEQSGIIDNFRSFLKQNFKNKYGKEIDFENNREKAQELYHSIKAFLEETDGVQPENFQEAMSNYIQDIQKQRIVQPEVCVLGKQDFNSLFKDNSSFLKLYLSDWIFSKDSVEKFKSGADVLNLQFLKGGNFKNEKGKILKATNCEGVANYFKNSAGPWRVFSLGEFAVDLNSLKIVDENYLNELVAIIQHDYPQEFGFIDEIEKYANIECLKKYYYDCVSRENAAKKPSISKEELDKKVSDKVMDAYLNVPNIIFNSFNKFLDDFYKNKNIGCSYFDLFFHKYDKQFETEIYDKVNKNASFKKEINDYEKQHGLFVENDEDCEREVSTFFTNKNFAVLKNFNLLASILGYDVVFSAYEDEGELVKSSMPKVVSNKKNGDYVLLNCEKLFICNGFKFTERNDSYEVTSEEIRTLN